MDRKKQTNKIAIFLIFIGIIIICMPYINRAIFEVKSSMNIEMYEDNIERISKEEQEKEKRKLRIENQKINEKDLFDSSLIKEFESLDKEKNNILGIIIIPKINVELPIYEGTTKENLNKGIGHLKGTSNLINGVSSHSVLVGHSGLSNSTMFDRLNELNISDVFYIKAQNEVLKYEIVQKNIILPDECDLKIEENENLCTLVTCTPYRVNTHRLLATGKLEKTINKEELEESYQINDINNLKKIIAKNIIVISENNYFKIYIFIILGICVIISAMKVLRRKDVKKK